MSTRGRKNRGTLSPEDRDLWTRVTKTLTPLHAEHKMLEQDLDDVTDQPALEDQSAKTAKPETSMRPPPKSAEAAPLPPLHQLEHRYRRKVVRGAKTIDGRIDLHGLTQHQAHGNLRAFLYRSQARGHKLVLVITGKGGDGFMDERGVLRRVVPQWLAMPDMRHVVVGYEQAHASHGGAGALYVRIRRKR
ncbi:DNA mismatch repair protein MutS [Roseibium aquae]|uniref:DNA mismatch repair protein MutS n=1 Tax=Roseibium aquae TaxID=1323746 RepID=A0A916WYL6_9HYPH|nr:Smr/MutS family protein [Roseibium aquae]GGB40684.1 DNA mismatch repair protein MutS [Roseibium aquae]